MKNFIKKFIKFRKEMSGQPYRSHFVEMSGENVIRLFKIYLDDAKQVGKE